jgi:uncharacterized protein (TIGR00369 family)
MIGNPELRAMNDAKPSMQFGIVPLETIKSMSGLEFLQAMAAGRLPAPPISRLLGFAAAEFTPGQAVFTVTPTLDHYNPIGSVHGGLAGTLLDSTMSCAVQTTLAQGQGYTTLEYRVHLVRAMTDQTGPVRAEGRVIHVGRRMATAEGRIVDSQGTLYAHGTTTCMIFDL